MSAATGSGRACPTTSIERVESLSNVEVSDPRGGDRGLRRWSARRAHGHDRRSGGTHAGDGRVRVHRRPAADRLARRRRGARRARVHPLRGLRSSGSTGDTAGGSSATRSRSRRACPACSWPATSATYRSSAWLRRWGRARCRCSSCTSTLAACSRPRADDRRPPQRCGRPGRSRREDAREARRPRTAAFLLRRASSCSTKERPRPPFTSCSTGSSRPRAKSGASSPDDEPRGRRVPRGAGASHRDPVPRKHLRRRRLDRVRARRRVAPTLAFSTRADAEVPTGSRVRQRTPSRTSRAIARSCSRLGSSRPGSRTS